MSSMQKRIVQKTKIQSQAHTRTNLNGNLFYFIQSITMNIRERIKNVCEEEKQAYCFRMNGVNLNAFDSE